MIVAVAAVNVVQMAFYQIVHMITVGNRLMSATRSMFVAFFMPITEVVGSTTRRIRCGDLNDMLIDMIFM
jgi:hypothetical protein